jgi:hypothetical protein
MLRRAGDQADAFRQNVDATGLVDEIERAMLERLALMRRARKSGQEDDRNLDPVPAKLGQHVDAVVGWQLPVQDDDVGTLPLLKVAEQGDAICQRRDVKAQAAELDRSRLAKVVIVVH